MSTVAYVPPVPTTYDVAVKRDKSGYFDMAFFHELTPVVPVDITGDHIAEIEKALAELTKLIAKLKQNHAEQESF